MKHVLILCLLLQYCQGLTDAYCCVFSGAMDELHSLDPRRQELLEARFMGGISGSTGSTGSTSGGTKVSGSMTYSLSLIFIYLFFS